MKQFIAPYGFTNFHCSQVERHSLLWMQIIFLSHLSPIWYFSSFFAVSDLDDLIDEIIKTNNRGVSIGRNGSAVASWSFGQSFFFSSTVVTTIGYGHQTPLSPEGKFFCILYALIGIPMTMLLITAVVDKLMMPVNLLLIWINNTMGHLYSPFSLRLFHLLLVIYVLKKFTLHNIWLFQNEYKHHLLYDQNNYFLILMQS